MDSDVKFNYLRQKLNLLGYEYQTLPISAIGIVSAILDDLIITTEALKDSKDQISKLLEEKKAWELGNEVYKCDNSKLLSELNRLKLELLNKERNIEVENADLRRKIRNLEADKKEAEQRIASLTQTIYQYSQSDRIKSKKPQKPFISTVRANNFLPDPAFITDAKDGCKCLSATSKKNVTQKEIEKLRSDLKYTQDLMAILRKQDGEKEREIQRLHCLLVGGRPTSALAKDCCYSGVSQKMIFEIEYLKDKMKENENRKSSRNCEIVAELIKERDILQNKVRMLTEFSEKNPRKIEDCNIPQLYCRLKDKETEIMALQEEIQELRCERGNLNPKQSYSNLAVTNSLRRLECEKDCALNKLQSMNIENEALNDKIRIMSDGKINESKRIMQLEETIAKLKMEIDDYQASKTPTFQTIKKLREENCDLQMKLRTAHEDYSKLKSTHNQSKMLSQQTESVLINVQNQLEFTKCELNERESQINSLNKSNECLKDQIEKLSVELGKIKSLKSTVEREKEFYMMTLDKRNEKLHSVEVKAESALQMRDSNRLLKMKIDELNCEIKRHESIVCDTTSENNCLKKQLEATKHHLTNAIHENSRMADELTSITATLNATKKCLSDSQRESENIRTKLQSYIHEIERIDGLIAIKDNERKQALVQSKDLECDNIKLMEKFQCLDQKSSETKRQMSEYQHQITILTDQLQGKENDLETLEKQVIDLSTEIEMLRSANAKVHVDLEAQRNLCDKLDIQKEKQQAELHEYQLQMRVENFKFLADYKWESCHINSPAPNKAIIGGRDSDGSVIYVARSLYCGMKIPAKAIPSKRACYIPFNGLEILVENFEILTGDSSEFSWVTYRQIVTDAVVTDKIANENIYVGRAKHSNSLTVGKFQPSKHFLFIPYGGKEHSIESFELLTYKKKTIKQTFLPGFEPRLGYMSFAGNFNPGNCVPTLQRRRIIEQTGYPRTSTTTPTTIVASPTSNAPNLEWKQMTSASSMPSNAIQGGRESNYTILYVGRCMHEGHLMPCKVIPSRKVACVSFNGVEIEKKNFEILVGSVNGRWVPYSNGNVPGNAFVGGYTKQGELFYVGRVLFNNAMLVGRINKSRQCIYVSSQGREYSFSNYEVLMDD
ncbi:CLUMA_CG003994, isoform A [Clunio marinus]|uniref:CLUMA_CG003994, isoform A n=1 Tax=Clunio marinus TaxID=568069 RepID=A0A1J1HSL5_9DIPT|nr:CLUMA_CG003994, isoform A [Clunio marinus]